MKNRIFIAINLPLDIKKQLLIYQQEIDKLFVEDQGLSFHPIKWVKQDNLHITLIFIGQINQPKLINVAKIVQQIKSNYNSFPIELFEITYGPPGNYDFETKKIPRMIWVNVKCPKELFSFQMELRQKLEAQNIIQKGLKNKFSVHITLGRINQWQWKTIEPDQRPIIKKHISLNCPINSIEIMNSKLSSRGAQYTVYKSFKLN